MGPPDSYEAITGRWVEFCHKKIFISGPIRRTFCVGGFCLDLLHDSDFFVTKYLFHMASAQYYFQTSLLQHPCWKVNGGPLRNQDGAFMWTKEAGKRPMTRPTVQYITRYAHAFSKCQMQDLLLRGQT